MPRKKSPRLKRKPRRQPTPLPPAPPCCAVQCAAVTEGPVSNCCIESGDAKFDVQKTREVLTGLGAADVQEVAP